MKESLNIEKLYYELAVLINQELYEENAISPNLYKQAETDLLKERK